MTLVIGARFNGPPGSGHGGYSAGVLAEALGGGPMAVSLKAPPPLDTPLEVRDGGAWDGDRLVLAAEPASVEAEPPPAVAAPGRDGSPWGEDHPFPTCFGCGPQRAPGDALRLFAWPAGDGGVHAAAWRPAAEFAGADGAVHERFVWAALDCPSAAPFAHGGAPVVLARFAVRIDGPVRAGEPHVIGAWPVAVDGRKHRSGVALWDAAGRPLAAGDALWIALRG